MSVPPDGVGLARPLEWRDGPGRSRQSRRGSACAVARSRDRHARVAQLVVVFVHDLPAAAVIGAVGVGGTGRCRMRCEIDAVKERFASTLADLAGFLANGTSPAAIPPVKLSAAATEFDAELIVVGSGRRGTRRRGAGRRLQHHTTRSTSCAAGDESVGQPDRSDEPWPAGARSVAPVGGRRLK